MGDGAKQLLPEQPGAGRLGRHLHHDPRNRAFPARGVLTPQRLPRPRSRPWYSRYVFDQGATSSCTAQAAAGCLLTAPLRAGLPKANLLLVDTHEERLALYRRAQQVDPWPGDEETAPQYQGSSTDAPFRVLRDQGAIREWRWCFGLEDVLAVLRSHGPVAVGTVWLAGMDEPDSKGHVRTEGTPRGGHAYRLIHDDADDERVLAVNSWGRRWSNNGRFFLTYEQLDYLLGQDGEAVTVVLAG